VLNATWESRSGPTREGSSAAPIQTGKKARGLLPGNQKPVNGLKAERKNKRRKSGGKPWAFRCSQELLVLLLYAVDRPQERICGVFKEGEGPEGRRGDNMKLRSNLERLWSLPNAIAEPHLRVIFVRTVLKKVLGEHPIQAWYRRGALGPWSAVCRCSKIGIRGEPNRRGRDAPSQERLTS